MRCSSLIPALVAGSFVTAAPIEECQQVAMDFNPPPGGDTTILNYALTLEYLERKFYMEGIANYSHNAFIVAGFPDPFYDNLKEIYYDEQTHVSFLDDSKSFVALSSVLEGVIVSVQLGAAAAIADKTYVPIACSILTVESRHSSYIRAALGEFPFPKPFDTPLDFNQAYSLAAEFITASALGAAPLPFKTFPPLVIQPSKYYYTAGSSSVTFTHAKKNAFAAGFITHSIPVYALLFSGLDKYCIPVYETQGSSGEFKFDMLPSGGNELLPPTGQVYVVLSTADGKTAQTMVSDENTISGVGIIEVSPLGDRGQF